MVAPIGRGQHVPVRGHRSGARAVLPVLGAGRQRAGVRDGDGDRRARRTARGREVEQAVGELDAGRRGARGRAGGIAGERDEAGVHERAARAAAGEEAVIVPVPVAEGPETDFTGAIAMFVGSAGPGAPGSSVERGRLVGAVAVAVEGDRALVGDRRSRPRRAGSWRVMVIVTEPPAAIDAVPGDGVGADVGDGRAAGGAGGDQRQAGGQHVGEFVARVVVLRAGAGVAEHDGVGRPCRRR